MRTNYCWLIPLLFFLFVSKRGNAAAVLFDEESGLSNNYVNCIIQEKSGLMWIGTNSGLNNFDGYSFFEVPELKQSKINCLLYDKERDKIWVGTSTGLFYINCDTKQIIRCTGTSRKSSVQALMLINENVYVLFNKFSLMEIKPDDRCRVIYQMNSAELIYQYMTTVDDKGNIYIALEQTKRIIKIPTQNSQQNPVSSTPFEGANSIHWSDYGLLVSSAKGITQLNGDSVIPWYFTKMNKLSQGLGTGYIRQDKEHLYFISWGTIMNLYKINLSNKSIQNISAQKEPLLYAKIIYCLYEDEYQTLWIGTNRGILRIPSDPPRPSFEQLLVDSLNPISTRNIIENENGDLYIASYSGLYTLADAKTTKQAENKSNRKNIDAHALYNTPHYLYIGAEAYFNFARLNKTTERLEIGFLKYRNIRDKLITPVVTIARDCNGLFWLGNYNGLFCYNEKTDSIFKYTETPGIKDIHSITMRKDKLSFWIASAGGVYLIDLKKGMQLYLNDKTVPAIPSAAANIIYETPDGNIWIGTPRKGINILSPDFKTIRILGKKEGLSSNEVYGILSRDSDEVWISTYNGLNYYNSTTGIFTNYFQQDGLTQNEFNLHSSFRSSSGKFYFGGINGITAFYPIKIPSNKNPFGIFLSTIYKFDKPSDQFMYTAPDIDNTIVMNPNDNQLTLSFGISDFSLPEKVNYYYMIDGISKGWQSFHDNHSLRLESLLLSPGKYILKIKARKGYTEYSSNILEYSLSITQVFYKTIWFYVMVAFLLILGIYIYFRTRLYNLQKLELLRVKISSNLHDEVGSILTQIAMFSDALSKKMSDKSEIQDKLENMAQLSREANLAMNDVLWTIDARNDFVLSLTDRMREHAEDMLLQKDIHLDFDFSEVEHLQKSTPEFRQHFFWIFKESINNIIKHSRATHVSVQYTQSGEHGRLVVKNNGISDNQGYVNTGLGLKNIRMRTKILKGRVDIKTEDDHFIIEINF